MNSRRVFFVQVGILSSLLIGLLAGAYVGNTLLTAKAQTVTNLKARSQAQTLQQQSLAKVKKEIQKYTELKKITQTIVPEDKSQAEAVREIVAIAKTSGTPITSITYPTSTLGSTGATGSTTAPSAAISLTSKATRLSQLTPVKGMSGVYEITITVQNDAANPVYYNQFIRFLEGLEKNRRTAQVTAVSVVPSADNPKNLTYNLSITEYIKP